MINGGIAVEKNLKQGKIVADHWVYFYKGFRDGIIDLDKEYEKVIGSEYLDEFEQMGVFEESTIIRDFFQKEQEKSR